MLRINEFSKLSGYINGAVLSIYSGRGPLTTDEVFDGLRVLTRKEAQHQELVTDDEADGVDAVVVGLPWICVYSVDLDVCRIAFCDALASIGYRVYNSEKSSNVFIVAPIDPTDRVGYWIAFYMTNGSTTMSGPRLVGREYTADEFEELLDAYDTATTTIGNASALVPFDRRYLNIEIAEVRSEIDGTTSIEYKPVCYFQEHIRKQKEV